MPLTSCVCSEIAVSHSKFQPKKDLGNGWYSWAVSASDGLILDPLQCLVQNPWLDTNYLLLANPGDCLALQHGEILFHPVEKQNKVCACVHVVRLLNGESSDH